MLQYVCTPKALGGFFDVSIDLSWLLYGNWKKKKKKVVFLCGFKTYSDVTIT